MLLFRSSFLIFIFFFLVIGVFLPSKLSLFKNHIPVFLGLVMFLMGMTLELIDFKKIFKRPSLFFFVTFFQFTIMPVTAFVLVKTFNISSELALGIIILGCCPGGTASNLITYLCNGNVALSIVCTFFSTIVSVFLTPILIFLLSSKNINIDVIALIKSSFLIVFLPVFLGLFFKILIPMERVTKFLPKISEFFIAFIIGIIFSLNLNLLSQLSYSLFFCIVLHNFVGLGAGFLMGGLLGLSFKEKKTISIEVGMQNSGLGMALSILHFSKIVALPSAIFSLWHNISAVGLVYCWKKK
jgi:BASS family bile acid:Na+ symporter